MSDLTAITVAEAVLEYASAVCAKLGSPADSDLSGDASTSKHLPSVKFSSSVDLLLFDNLLNQQRSMEREFTETGYAAFPAFSQCLTCSTNSDGHITCTVGAVVHNTDLGSVVIKFYLPIIDRLVGTHVDRPLADKLRVCTYLVSLASQAVSSDSNAVSFLTHACGTLRELIRLTRLQESNSAQQDTNSADDQATNIQPIHKPSIPTQERDNDE